MLKFETNEIPTGLESYYEEAGNGLFKLKVEGAIKASEAEETKTKLGEFRNTNIELKRKVEELARFETMFKTGEFSAEKLNSKIEEQALVKAAEMKAAYEAQIAELTTKLTGTSAQFENIVVNNAISAAALKHGVSETALEDVNARAKAAFKVQDGNLVAADGVLDAKGKPMTVDSWMTTLAEKAPHLFNASRGAGAQKPNRAIPALEKKSAVDLISAGMAKRR